MGNMCVNREVTLGATVGRGAGSWRDERLGGNQSSMDENAAAKPVTLPVDEN